MTDDEDANDPQLRSLRAIWLAMPDEEPPERGLAELMAAARVKADEMAKPSLWDRIVAQLRRPPVLALATVMVLIGGAVLIGTKQEKMEAEPTIPSTAPVQETAPAPGSASPAVQAPMEEPAAAPVGAATPDPEPAPPPPPTTVKRPRPPAKDTKTTTGADTNKYKAEGDAIRKAEESSLELRDERAEGGKVAAPETISADGFVDSQTKGTASAPPPPSNTDRAKQYVQKAKAALKNNNCQGARSAMSTARKLDQSVWTEAQRDQHLASCLSTTAAE